MYFFYGSIIDLVDCSQELLKFSYCNWELLRFSKRKLGKARNFRENQMEQMAYTIQYWWTIKSRVNDASTNLHTIVDLDP